MSPIPLLLAAALLLPTTHDLAHEEPDPIPEAVHEYRLELALEELHDTNGPYITPPIKRQAQNKVSARNLSNPRLKKGHEADTLRWRPLAERYFGSAWPKALCIISFESGGNPNAKSRSGTYRGLFQQSNRYWAGRAESAGWGGANIYDPEANIAVSAWLVNNGGWGHWTITRCR